MSLFSRSIMFISFACLFVFSSSMETMASPTAKVAKVGNVVITQEDVLRRTQSIMPLYTSFHSSASEEQISKAKQEALDELVLRAYKVQYAINEEVDIDSEAFERLWEKRLNKNKQTVSNFSPEQLSRARFYYYFDFLAKSAEKAAVDDRVQVSGDDVQKYYENNKNKFYRPELFTASHIMVRVNPSDNLELKEQKRLRAQKLFERAKSGEDFYNLAYYESDDRSKYVGGSLGSFHAGQTVEEFDAAIQEMKVGEVAGPVKTLYGYHVIRLDGLEEEKQLEFKEVEDKVRKNLEEQNRKRIKSEWIESLEKKYPVVYFEE